RQGAYALRDFLAVVCLPHCLSSVSTIRQASIVTNITTSCGFRTVRVGKRNSARNAAGNRAAALGWIGLWNIGSSSAVAAIGLCICRLHPNGHSQNAHACDTGQSAYTHHQRGPSPLKTSATLARCRRQVPARLAPYDQAGRGVYAIRALRHLCLGIIS